MMRFSGMTERWTPMVIRGVKGYFSDVRIERNTIPEEFNIWELADADSNGEPCRYRPGILVNFYGTFITTGELPVDDPTYKAGYIESDDDWDFTGTHSLMMYEIKEMERMNGKMK